MTHMLIETFDDAGKAEMEIDLPTSVLDLNTKVVTSEKPVTITRSEFRTHGERWDSTPDPHGRTRRQSADGHLQSEDETVPCSDKTK